LWPQKNHNHPTSSMLHKKQPRAFCGLFEKQENRVHTLYTIKKTPSWIVGFLSFVLLPVLFMPQASGVTIVDFDMGGATVDSADPLAPSTVAANVSVSNLTTVGLGTANSLVDVYARDGWNSSVTINPSNFYYTFTITPDPGYQIDFGGGGGEFALKRENVSGAQNFSIRASTTGDFSSGFINVRNGNSWPSGDGSGLWESGSTTLGNTTITNSTPLEVRYYFFNDGGGGGYAGLTSEAIVGSRTNNFWGTVSLIPEPSTYALIFGGTALAIALYLKRKRVREQTELS